MSNNLGTILGLVLLMLTLALCFGLIGDDKDEFFESDGRVCIVLRHEAENALFCKVEE